MIKRSIIYILLLFVTCATAQVSSGAEIYNSFTSRNFMKFNRFLTVPTFSALRENKTSLNAIVRNSFVEFEDSPKLYMLSYSGKMRENVGAGLAIYQQEIGVFKDFGALANYAHRIQLNDNLDLTFGFNVLYSRRSADGLKVNSQQPDPAIGNFQDIPIVNWQPAVTLSFGKFDVGVFFENLLDFNLKENNLATSFSEKTISGHLMYSYEFTYAGGIFEGADLRVLGLARKPGQGDFGYGGNVIFDLPKVGWLKAGYDKQYGISAGAGVNLSDKLSIGFSYEKGDFAATNEVGLIYNFGEKSFSRRVPKRRAGSVSVRLPERKPKKNYRNNDLNNLSEEIQGAYDSINKLNKKVDEILRILKNQPPKVVQNQPEETQDEVVDNAVVEESEEKDTSLRRRKNTPWRESTITRSGSGGTAYYVAANQFKSKENVEAYIKEKKRKFDKEGIEAKYVFDPLTEHYYVYFDRFAKKDDADEMTEEFKQKKLFDGGDDDPLELKGKTTYKEAVYVMKITLGGSGESYQEPKPQTPARILSMKKVGNLEEGYYIQVGAFGSVANADRFVDELRNDDIDAGYFIHPNTGLRHVYILKTTNRSEAVKLYENNLNGSYYDRKSIVNIK
ncbi:type IX secretion system membrane protein, PorP/SprF family [Tenacibaculum sp. MAR_2009_124]|uniref:PorP/SprF family type IX secretion system membrane protein n=1 Tax=Tenacibaculum sp. MAR_2009_124 TaxID=1250059 RepID=UPI00089BFCB3|nr:PorP/SprF family type IX secretion system membrane protein [Tenacibaculum sp. MAR_2009_124]SEC95408.1 type IX secretion system membrane protein, PorP/SprF family [Tenacibaculum sp. MAR_2009_124]